MSSVNNSPFNPPDQHGKNDSQDFKNDSPFLTTSDVLNQLNKHLSNLSSPEDDVHMKPRFELQKRLPDGSAIPASADEIAAADFKTKLEQSATFVSQLATPQDRQYWAEQQRQQGNSFFSRGDYKGAMDIYLTCLVVKENTPDFVNKTLLPVLNNLAQCTSQLGMHKKTILFCEMAITESEKAMVQDQQPTDADQEDEDVHHDNTRTTSATAVDYLSLCKIHFKKAKALRLTGNYVPARTSLNASLDHLEAKEKETCVDGLDTPPDSMSLESYRQAIQKEFKYLDTAEKAARKNRQRQKSAMQRAMSSQNSATKNSQKATRCDLGFDQEGSTIQAEPRKFSRLRARKFAGEPEACGSNGNTKQKKPSYIDYYWSMVARVTQYLLQLIGDDESDCQEDKEKKRI
ncbi:hypothetical protein IV203_017154 [Nitzschia inconspicua]|uniref:Uncharacterized protein n=1 Tax=Nitzschia inconspicua TaxID=303405 RepID=A0A9K3PKQ1_9STRA|nr:hypothetical protein IV203_017154 [Nitzschia inconspicua]